ncbi:E3 ubiquitin-protein ligase RNF19A-like [Patiria miniata]|uniref:RBR-type E3 ubiquitin transferase n=1 Tax=Patiria miniata TaxID=46514 RepID=A0A913ZM82_PATMI|nr:E3 ubiquitin-protein ligase RNF19A-like [Patiria miniata]
MKGPEIDTRSIQSGTSQATTDSVKRKKQSSFIPRFLQRQSKPRRGSLDTMSGHSSSGSTGTPPAKSYRRAVSTQGAGHQRGTAGRSLCPLCLMDRPKDQFPDIMTCEHRSCRECLRQYLKIEITESRVNIACPECAEPLHPNDIKLVLQDEMLMNKYEEFTLRRLLMMDSDCRWCPAPDCGFAVIAAGCANCPQLACLRPGCGTFFCYHCKQVWHPDQTCDAARQQRQGLLRKTSRSYSQGSASSDQIKPCPRCTALIIKMDDGSCNHMSCAVCGAEFCWLCMKEISDLHYLSPSGCTFWGKKPWSRKKKILWQLGTLVGAPVGIALIAGIAIPAIIIGIPVYVGRKVHGKYSNTSRHRRNLAIAGSVTMSVLVSPVIAALTVGIGVPILLAYVYGVVPVSLCRSGGCGVTTSDRGGVRIDFEDDNDGGAITPGNASDANPDVNSAVVNASIGEASMNRESYSHLEVAGVIGDDTVSDNASTRAIAGASLTGSLSGSGGVGPLVLHSHRLDVHAEVVNSNQTPSHSSETASINLCETCIGQATTGTLQLDRENNNTPLRRDPLEFQVDMERRAYKTRLSSGSCSSTENSHLAHSASGCHILGAAGCQKTSTEDVWELKSNVSASSGANPTSAMRKTKSSKSRTSRSGRKNSVKISDRITEAPSASSCNHDNVSINDSINSELSAALADSECTSECSSSSNIEGAIAASASQSSDLRWKGHSGGRSGISDGGRSGIGDGVRSGTSDVSESLTSSTSSQRLQIGEGQPPISLTEVEVDRPQLHLAAVDGDKSPRVISLEAPASIPSLTNMGVRSTDL